jgi:hypothetical protein
MFDDFTLCKSFSCVAGLVLANMMASSEDQRTRWELASRVHRQIDESGELTRSQDVSITSFSVFDPHTSDEICGNKEAS